MPHLRLQCARVDFHLAPHFLKYTPDKKLRKCELTEGTLIFERGGGGEGRASENHLVFRGNAKGSALMIRPDPRQAPPRLVSKLPSGRRKARPSELIMRT